MPKKLRKEVVNNLIPKFKELDFEYENIKDYSIEIFRKVDTVTNTEHLIILEFNHSYGFLEIDFEVGIRINEVEEKLEALGYKNKPENIFLTIRTKLGRYLTNKDGLRGNPEERTMYSIYEDEIPECIEHIMNLTPSMLEYFDSFKNMEAIHKSMNYNVEKTSSLIFELPDMTKKGLIICSIVEPNYYDKLVMKYRGYLTDNYPKLLEEYNEFVQRFDSLENIAN